MSRKQALYAVLLCAVVCLCSSALFGQATGSFSGTVTDNSGAVVAGAKVTVTAQATNVAREATTDDTGHYTVPLLGVGDFTIRVEGAGFKAAESRDVRLQVDEHRELDFKLNPASVSTTVEVNATEVAVQTSNATLGQVITSQEVAELPLNGRDFVQLATLTPGTTQETNPGSFFNGGPSSEVSARGTYSLSVGGSRAQSTDWLLDGNDNNELTAGGIAILPSIDAIQEFKVLTYNYSAEWGTRAGPTVLVTTKSGSNQYHGSLFEFFRNTKLDARSYFAAFREQFNLNQFGGSFGGPIKKDKTFFFIDYQAKQQRHGIPFVGLVPTPAMMGGDFTDDPLGAARPGFAPGAPAANADGFGNLTNPYTSSPFQCDGSGNPLSSTDGTQAAGVPCNKIPIALAGQGGMADPTGLALMQLYPLSTTPNFTTVTNYANVPARKLNEGEFDIRLDHNFSNKDSLFARFSYDQAVSFVPGGSPGFAEQGAFASTQDITNHGRNATISETHILSSNNINQATFGFNRIFNHISSFGTGTCEAAKLGIQGADLGAACSSITGYPTSLNQSSKDCISCGLSSIQMTNYWSLGDRGFAPFIGGTNVYTFNDTFDMIRGKHNVRVGVGIRANQMNVETNGFGDGYFLMFGSYTGDAAADLLLGQIGGGIHDQTFLGATTGRRWKMYRPFVQDDWRVTNNLTVNLGLAWALVTPITEAGGRQANFDFGTGQYLVAGSSPQANCAICVPSGGNVGVQFDKTALEPRIGFAWKVLGSQTTVLRGGYAIFHDSAWNQGAQGLWQNPPYYAETDNFSGLCAFGNATSALPTNCGLQLGLLQPNLQPFLSPPDPSTFTGTIQSQNLDFKQGMVQQFNLNVDHQLPGSIVLTAGYAGSRSHHILVDGVNENVGSPTACGVIPGYTLGCGPGGTAFSAPYGPFTVISNNNDVGSARYDSLQVKAETKSSRHGLYALLGYTWSRTFDSGFPDGVGTSPGATYWPLPGSQKLDWGLSQLNLNDQFTASVLYDLPFGKGKHYGSTWSGPVNAVLGNWELNVIEKATSGFPLFVVDSSNPSGVNFMWNGNVLSRPDQVGDPNRAGPVAGNPTCDAPAEVHTVAHWFNSCAFISAPAGELGDTARAPVSGPRFVNTDFSAIKNFVLPFREGMSVQFRAEFFNLFNHSQFFLPGGASGMQDVNAQSSFGVISATVNNPRVIQFALKLKF
ncbi:MAG TPA: carboxypeptidase-like regulatory domain-containing protein [Candidatus Sulfotelmatobacter sp.]|nr:carboxypeptidase-like regulatory domain-containing protein [Candidatus Sulfotelmatobacter sp.]